MAEKPSIQDSYMKNRPAIKTAFWKDASLPSVQLGGFLSKTASLALRREIAKLSFSRDDDPINHCYEKAPVPPTLKTLFSSEEFLAFMSFIIEKKARGIDVGIFRFDAGDYALRHEEGAQEPRFDIVFDIEGLAAGAGGSVVFVDGSGSYHAIAPSPNALTIVKRKRGVQRFVQYHNHYATGRHLVLGTLCIGTDMENAVSVAKERG